ncbi:hypothetical protein X975_25066, partial [Stegodyphus mimosarum]
FQRSTANRYFSYARYIHMYVRTDITKNPFQSILNPFYNSFF